MKSVNLGNDKEFTVKEIAYLIKKLTDSSSKFNFRELPEDDPQKRRRPDTTLAQKIFRLET